MKSDSQPGSPNEPKNDPKNNENLAANKMPFDPRHIEEAIAAVISYSMGRGGVEDECESRLHSDNPNVRGNVTLGNPRTSNFTDLPENLLESSTPPFDQASLREECLDKLLLNNNSSNKTVDLGPVFAAMTPVNVDLHGLLQMDNSLNSFSANVSTVSSRSSDVSTSGAGAFSGARSSSTCEPTMAVPGISHLFSSLPSNLSGALANTVTVGLAGGQQQSQSTIGQSSNVSSLTGTGFLPTKVESQDVFSANTVLSSVPTALLSPSQLNLGVSPRNPLNLANISTPGEYLSLQPAAVYVQPVTQNGQLQFLKVNFSYSTTIPSSSDSSTLASPLSKLNSCSTNNTTSTVELTNNLIASMLQQPGLPSSCANLIPNSTAEAQSADQVAGNNNSTKQSCFPVSESGELPSLSNNNDAPRATAVSQRVAIPPKKRGRSSSSGCTSAVTSPSGSAPSQIEQVSTVPAPPVRNAGETSGDEGDDIYIDTRELCSRIAYELKVHSIPQAIFAEKVLCRSQGTLSDLLRNPKPWNKLKSGRETFRRMYQWLKQPLYQRLSLLEPSKECSAPSSLPKTATERVFDEEVTNIENSEGAALDRRQSIDSFSGDQDLINDAAISPTTRQESQSKGIKKPRLVFTDIQKRTLQAIFKETQRPSREMQQTIAEHLGLDLSTVQNFFMNARRRSRVDLPQADSPAPYQQIRSITPPPTSPSPPLDSSASIFQQAQHQQRFDFEEPDETTITEISISNPRITPPKVVCVSSSKQPLDAPPTESRRAIRQQNQRSRFSVFDVSLAGKECPSASPLKSSIVVKDVVPATASAPPAPNWKLLAMKFESSPPLEAVANDFRHSS